MWPPGTAFLRGSQPSASSSAVSARSTQNSLPSGSASTTQVDLVALPPRPPGRAPRPSSRATSAAWSSGRRSMCRRFLTTSPRAPAGTGCPARRRPRRCPRAARGRPRPGRRPYAASREPPPRTARCGTGRSSRRRCTASGCSSGHPTGAHRHMSTRLVPAVRCPSSGEGEPQAAQPAPGQVGRADQDDQQEDDGDGGRTAAVSSRASARSPPTTARVTASDHCWMLSARAPGRTLPTPASQTSA